MVMNWIPAGAKSNYFRKAGCGTARLPGAEMEESQTFSQGAILVIFACLFASKCAI
jgi:hypothetical protein